MPDGTVAGCYAKALAECGVAKKAYPQGFEHHYWRPTMLKELAAGREPLLIFCDSMSDLFAANVPQEHVEVILQAMARAPHHSYQSLTKAAPQLLKYLQHLPPNLWVGVSSPPDWFRGRELSPKQQQAKLRKSLEVLAEVRQRTGNLVWLSAEPISWDLCEVLDRQHPLDWIVMGAASNGRHLFQPDCGHVRRLLQLMDETGTPVFFKGNLGPLFEQSLGSPELDRWREDFPAHYRSGEPIPAVVRRQEQCLVHGWAVSCS